MVEYITALGSIATPIIVLIATGLGWSVRRRWERVSQLEDKLREDRIEAYNQILEPFIIMFTSDAAWATDPKNKNKDKYQLATTKMLSLEYRKVAFKMSLVAPDEVVKSYNDLMQFFFRQEVGAAQDRPTLIAMVKLIGRFLLEIRRGMGNEETQLDHWEMLEWFMTEARQFRADEARIASPAAS